MKESKLIKLLRNFDKAEIKRFIEFVNSPYFNKNRKNCEILSELIKFHPDFDATLFSEEVIYKKCFKVKEYNYFTMKNVLSDLHNLAIQFLLLEHKGERAVTKEIKILEVLREKEVFDEYKSRLNKIKTKLDKEKISSEFYYYDKNHLLSEEILYTSIISPNTRFDLKQEELNSEVNFSLIKLLKLYTLFHHELISNNYPFEMTMIDEIAAYLGKNTFEDEPIIDLYKNILALRTTNEHKYYQKLLEIRDKYFYSFDKDDRYMLFIHMRSYCTYNMNLRNDEILRKECFALDKYHYDKGELIHGKILYPDFILYVRTSIAANELDWTEKFINEYKDELADDVRENVLNYCYGLIEYAKGNLKKALERIYKVNFGIFIMQIQVYINLTKIYYEIGYYEEAINLSRTAKVYLKKEIAPGIMQTNLKKFFNYTAALINLQLSVESRDDKKYKHNKLKIKIEEMKYYYFGAKLWLDEQAKKLKI